MTDQASPADKEIMAAAQGFIAAVDAFLRGDDPGRHALELATQRVEASLTAPGRTREGMAAAYALAGPAADRLIDWDETEGQAAVAFSLRGRGDAGKREIEAEVMGDGQTVPALGTGGGGAGHRFVAEVRSRWVRVRGLK